MRVPGTWRYLVFYVPAGPGSPSSLRERSRHLYP
jgi:hypothetical protein